MNINTAIFYSENSNNILANKVKRILDNFKIYTIYLKDIDDIILKKFIKIDFLILDFTITKLDDKSTQLIKKLYESGYIKRILVIRNSADKDESIFECIILNSNDTELLNTKINEIVFKPLNEIKVCDSRWVKIVGNFLTGIGFSFKQIGYSLMIDAIIYIMSKNGVIGKLKDDVYAYLSNKHDKSVPSIEINLRKTINMAFNKNKNFPFDYCPSNKEFIAYAITELYDKLFIKEVI